KSSTVRMIAEILRLHGLRAGAYLSPHLTSFAERIRVADEDLDGASFAAAVARAARAASLVDRGLAEGDRVTQFEALTAAAYSELARRGVEVAVIEAGLGGRYDATNVIPSEVQVLTNVGLEHTRWLGPTITDIAREKLAVVQDGGTLVVGKLHPDAEREAVAAAKRHAARLVHAPSTVDVPLPAYQRRNFALARAAAKAYLGQLDEDAVQRAAQSLAVPGRLQRIGERPLTLLDGAHNPDGAMALADALAELGDRWTIVLSILDDKDAAGMLRALLPAAERVILTRTSNPRALSPATLQSLARQVAGADLDLAIEPDPRRALDRARQEAGPDGRVVATGSIYLVADLLRPPGARAVSML